MNSVNFKIMIGLVVVFIIFTAFVLFSFLTDNSDDRFMESLALHQKIDEKQIESIKMSKVVVANSANKHIDIDLNKEQANRIITSFNSISSESIQSINNIESSSIISGIVIKMKDRSEVRIQYDMNNIYVSRPEIQYIIEDTELERIFENELITNFTIHNEQPKSSEMETPIYMDEGLYQDDELEMIKLINLRMKYLWEVDEANYLSLFHEDSPINTIPLYKIKETRLRSEISIREHKSVYQAVVSVSESRYDNDDEHHPTYVFQKDKKEEAVWLIRDID